MVCPVVVQKKQVCNAKCSFPKFLHWLLGDKFHLELSLADVVAGLISAVISVWHFQSRHYLSNNLFGVALSIQAIELMALGSYAAGAIMLVGLFLYDIFWVFGTEVMVTVATSFDAPIKLLFKRTHATVDTDAQFSLLGLGDIVIPGVLRRGSISSSSQLLTTCLLVVALPQAFSLPCCCSMTPSALQASKRQRHRSASPSLASPLCSTSWAS